MKETTKKLEDKIKIIKQSIQYANKQDFQSLLLYFKTGYSNVYGHVPSVLLEDDYSIYESFAIHFDKIIEPTCFSVDRETVKKTGELYLLQKGEKIGKINPHTKEIDVLIDFQKEKEQIKEEQFTLVEQKNSLQESQVEINLYLEKKQKKKTEFTIKLKEKLLNIPSEIEAIDARSIQLKEKEDQLTECEENIQKCKECLKKYDFIFK